MTENTPADTQNTLGHRDVRQSLEVVLHSDKQVEELGSHSQMALPPSWGEKQWE